MPLPTTPTEPENDQLEADALGPPSQPAEIGPLDPNAPLSFVPHQAPGEAPQAPIRIRVARYGELDEHELVKLLDSIEDERAKARFRESIYISVFFWLIVVALAFYGPRYLWHAPQVVYPMDVLKQRELTVLNAPVLPRHAVPPAVPKVDSKTLDKLRELTRRSPQPEPLPTPAPPPPASATTVAPQPSAPPPPPTPQPQPRPAPNIPDAPLPSAPRPSFSTPGTASDAMKNAITNSNGAGSFNRIPPIVGRSNGSLLSGGIEVLSDTEGVNFNPYLKRVMQEIYEQWLPLIPEEARPPLNKEGTTLVRFTIGKDGQVIDMHLDGSTHDDALNRAAWGSINGQQFPPLPGQFKGPNLELRIQFLYNQRP